MPPSNLRSNPEEAGSVKRLLLPTKAFERSAKRFLKKNPSLADDLGVALECLANDAFDPALRTHKLKGKLAGSWACSAGYDLRIVFQFVKYKNSDAVLLASVGSHDEVY
ncbi:MAG: plasmid stabilization system protein [Spartobacteria bacterium]|nr:plasmid stabilization system protein [Spartobacteria bacterium]